MRKFPSWNSLKHFNHVSTVSFTDGQSFYDILKVGSSLFIQDTLELFCISVHTFMYRAVASSKFTTDTLYSSLSVLSDSDWAAVHDRSTLQAS